MIISESTPGTFSFSYWLIISAHYVKKSIPNSREQPDSTSRTDNCPLLLPAPSTTIFLDKKAWKASSWLQPIQGPEPCIALFPYGSPTEGFLLPPLGCPPPIPNNLCDWSLIFPLKSWSECWYFQTPSYHTLTDRMLMAFKRAVPQNIFHWGSYGVCVEQLSAASQDTHWKPFLSNH